MFLPTLHWRKTSRNSAKKKKKRQLSVFLKQCFSCRIDYFSLLSMMTEVSTRHPLPCHRPNRRKMCACFDSSRKSTPLHAPVHYGTWRKRRTTSCMSSPSACLGRARWVNPCASERRRRPRLRPPRAKVALSNMSTHQACTLCLTFFYSVLFKQSWLGCLTISWLFSSKDLIRINNNTKREMKFHNRVLLKAGPCWPPH